MTKEMTLYAPGGAVAPGGAGGDPFAKPLHTQEHPLVWVLQDVQRGKPSDVSWLARPAPSVPALVLRGMPRRGAFAVQQGGRGEAVRACR